MPYYFQRAKVLGVYKQVVSMITPADIIIENDGRVKIPGIQIFDLMKGAKKILGPAIEASLDSVSKRILNYGKVEIMSIHQAWRTDTELLYEYNIKDVELCVLLDNKMPIHSYFFEQMALTGGSYFDLLTANYKICQQYIRYEKAEHPFLDDFMTPILQKFDKEDFDGAITMQPQVGIYRYIAVDDLDMMYPNIMLACNMSPETLVREEHFPEEVWKTLNPVKVGSYYFRTDFVGFIPKLIKKQISLRRDIERQIDEFANTYGKGFEKTEEFETFMMKRMNVKNLINSWYGVFGYIKFLLYNLTIAESVTRVGREQLMWSRDFVKEKYGIETIYGDSVSKDTPILIMLPDNTIDIIEIQDVSNEWLELYGKEYGQTNLRVWTDNGWATIDNVMRHKTSKSMYRVCTHTGIVDVTEDHSLLLVDGSKVRPTSTSVGTELLHSFPTKFQELENKITEDKAWCMGFFMADGSCGHYEYDTGDKYSWNVSKSKKFLEPVLDKFNRSHNIKFKLLDVEKSSQVWRIVPYNDGRHESVKELVIEYMCMYNNDRKKKVPKSILNSSRNIREAFVEGFYYGDGDKSYSRFSHKGKIASMGLYYLYKSLGYNVSVNFRSDKIDIYRLTLTKSSHRKNPNKIKKIQKLENTEDYVYDLTTSNGHFHAGVGQLIVHNTDSIFIETPEDVADLDYVEQEVLEIRKIDEELEGDLDDAMMVTLLKEKRMREDRILPEYVKIAEFHSRVGDEITASYDDFAKGYNIKTHAFSMKFEKLYKRIFFALHKTEKRAAKKRYAGHIVYKDDKMVDKLDIAGFPVKRSDTAKVTIDCQKAVLNTIVFDAYPEKKVYRIVRDKYLRVFEGKESYQDVGIPKGFEKQLRTYEKKSRTYMWYAAQWSNENLGTNFGRNAKPMFLPLRYFPPPYNKTNTYPNRNKNRFLAFNSDYPLSEDFIGVINWKLASDKTILQQMASITESIGISISSIKAGMVNNNVRRGF